MLSNNTIDTHLEASSDVSNAMRERKVDKINEKSLSNTIYDDDGFTQAARIAFEDFKEKHSNIHSRIMYLNEAIVKVKRQYTSAASSHFHTLDELISINDSNVYELDTKFANYINKSKQLYKEEISVLEARHNKSLNDINYEMEVIKNEEANRDEYSVLDQAQALEGIRSRSMENTNKLRVHMDARLEALQEQLTTDEITAANKTGELVHNLSLKNEQLEKEISYKKAEVEDFERNMCTIRTRMAQKQIDFDRKMKRLTSEKELLTEKYNNLSHQMDHSRQKN